MTAGDLSTVIEDAQVTVDQEEVEDEEELTNWLRAFEISFFEQVTTPLEAYHFATTHTTTTALTKYGGSNWIKLSRCSPCNGDGLLGLCGA